jgi:transcriptional regulator with XRE-family HTH domain
MRYCERRLRMAETPFSSAGATAAGTSSIRIPEVATPTYATLAHRAALLRDRVERTQDDVTDLHRETQLGELDERTAFVALQETDELLDELATRRGLSWSTMARMVGVSDAAIRKWRRGEAVAAENRRRLARAVAFLQMLADVFPVGDPGSWLEMRISEDATVTAIDVYADGRPDLLFEIVGQRLTPHQVLEAFDPDWRQNYVRDDRFAVVEAPDGEMAMVERRSEAK